jgi:TPR repeat protein
MQLQRMLDGAASTPVAGRSTVTAADDMFELGLAHSVGDGVPQDFVLAHKWLNLAAMRGSSRAREVRAEIAACMTPGQIAEAQRLAREWRPAS